MIKRERGGGRNREKFLERENWDEIEGENNLKWKRTKKRERNVGKVEENGI